VVVLDMARAAGIVGARDLEVSLADGGVAGSGDQAESGERSDVEDRCMSPKATELRMMDASTPTSSRPSCNWPVADRTARVIGRPDLMSAECGVIGEYDGAEHRSRSRQRDDSVERMRSAAESIGSSDRRIRLADVTGTGRSKKPSSAPDGDMPRRWSPPANPGQCMTPLHVWPYRSGRAAVCCASGDLSVTVEIDAGRCRLEDFLDPPERSGAIERQGSLSNSSRARGGACLVMTISTRESSFSGRPPGSERIAGRPR